ncbi:hypothetical protein SAMN05216548_102108 [Faunimonas pinastri]|uniref:Uncharacterized protein n=1 Tax=Faunimonas pinastri TaxID=1855383 RepID=A0A1H9CD42_9HYPH|nr:hypothetical protein SAMN05216548_102108 [Faunimonas pinastri]
MIDRMNGSPLHERASKPNIEARQEARKPRELSREELRKIVLEILG